MRRVTAFEVFENQRHSHPMTPPGRVPDRRLERKGCCNYPAPDTLPRVNRSGAIIPAMRDLVAIFASRCSDRATLDDLTAIISDRGRWRSAHGLFQRIRAKNLSATHANDKALEAQYSFEEVCAKTLYNLSGASAPFDADSPYWIVPNAIALARQLEIDDAEVLGLIEGGSRP